MRYKNYSLKVVSLGLITAIVFSFPGCGGNLNNKYMYKSDSIGHIPKKPACNILLKAFVTYLVYKILSNNTEVSATMLPDFDENTLNEYTDSSKRSLLDINNANKSTYDSYYLDPYSNASTGFINALSLSNNDLISVDSIDNQWKYSLAYSEFDTQYNINKTYIISDILDIRGVDVIHLPYGQIALLGDYINENSSFVHNTALTILKNNSIEKQEAYSSERDNIPGAFVYLNDTIAIAATYKDFIGDTQILTIERGILSNYSNFKTYELDPFRSYTTNDILKMQDSTSLRYAITGAAENELTSKLYILQKYNNDSLITIFHHNDTYQEGFALENTNDGGAISVGKALNTDTYNDAIAYKIFQNGTQAWANKYILRQDGIRFNSAAFAILKDRYAETEKFIVGIKALYNDLPRFVLLLQMSGDGDMLGINDIEGPIDDIEDMIQINNRTFLIAGSKYVNPDQENMMLIKKYLTIDTRNCSRNINITVSGLDNSYSVLQPQSASVNLNITDLGSVPTEKALERLDSSLCYSKAEDDIFANIIVSTTTTTTTAQPYNTTYYTTTTPITLNTTQQLINTTSFINTTQQPIGTTPLISFNTTQQPINTTSSINATQQSIGTTPFISFNTTQQPINTTSFINTTQQPIGTTPFISFNTTQQPINTTSFINTTQQPIGTTPFISFNTTQQPINTTSFINTTQQPISTVPIVTTPPTDFNTTISAFDFDTTISAFDFDTTSQNATTQETTTGSTTNPQTTKSTQFNESTPTPTKDPSNLNESTPTPTKDPSNQFNPTPTKDPITIAIPSNKPTEYPDTQSSDKREADDDGYVIAIVLGAIAICICLCCCCFCSRYWTYSNQRRYESF